MLLTITSLSRRAYPLAAVLSVALVLSAPGCGGSTPDASDAVVIPEPGSAPATPPAPATGPAAGAAATDKAAATTKPEG